MRILALASLLRRRGELARTFRLPTEYLAGCGALFVGYTLLLFLAIGWADSRQQVLEIGLLNYLWPALTLVLSLVLLRKRANWILVPGTCLALAGVFLVVTKGGKTMKLGRQEFMKTDCLGQAHPLERKRRG